MIAVVQQFPNRLKRPGNLLGKIRSQVMLDAADARIGDRQTRAGKSFDDPRYHLPRLDHIKADSDRPEFRGRHTAAGQMIVDPQQLAYDHANKLAARRSFHPYQFFHRESVADIIDQRRSVIEPVGIRNHLGPGDLLAALIETAMEIADLHVTVQYLLSFKF